MQLQLHLHTYFVSSRAASALHQRPNGVRHIRPLLQTGSIAPTGDFLRRRHAMAPIISPWTVGQRNMAHSGTISRGDDCARCVQ